MLYKYNKKSLVFTKVNLFKVFFITIVSIGLTIVGSLEIGRNLGRSESIAEVSEMERLVLIKEADVFSKDKLVQMLKDLNVKYPHIVLAQSIVETGRWESRIFFENHNLFGMREAKTRITTAGGTQYAHAYYSHWRESVYDYAFYQCRYLSKIGSEGEYFQYLSASYAEDTNYVNVLKDVIEKESLRTLFN